MIAVCMCGLVSEYRSWGWGDNKGGIVSLVRFSICSQRNSVSLVFSFDDSNKAKASSGQRKRETKKRRVSSNGVVTAKERRLSRNFVCPCTTPVCLWKKNISYIHLIRFSLSLAGIGS